MIEVPSEKQTATVLAVDLDGTLLSTDLMWESLLLLLKRQPWQAFKFPFWLIRGKAYFKHEVARHVQVDPTNLPFKQDVFDFVRREKARGREIILATAADLKAAKAIVDHVGIFTKILASDGRINLSGRAKSRALEKQYGYRGFDYVGNGTVDLPVWSSARAAILVGPTKRLFTKASRSVPVKRVFHFKKNSLILAIKAMRVHHWVKNALIFVPLVMAHMVDDTALLLKALLAFFSFSLCISGTYILNDLLDLEADRRHPSKKFRPFAAGTLPIAAGALAVPLLLTLSFSLAFLTLPRLFVATMALYVFATFCYTFLLKRVAIGDIILLAALYALRVIAGGVAIEVPVSAWLLAFSMFLFLSLAFLKRFTELNHLLLEGLENCAGRAYRGTDREGLQIMGTASGYLSILVLALYINSEHVVNLYSRPNALWLICPLLLYWITRIWFRAQRGEVDDDPIAFMMKDPFSYGIGAAIALLLVIAL